MGCKGSRVRISALRPTLTSVSVFGCVHLCVHFQTEPLAPRCHFTTEEIHMANVTPIPVSKAPRLPRPVEAALSEQQERTWRLSQVLECISTTIYATGPD